MVFLKLDILLSMPQKFVIVVNWKNEVIRHFHY